MPATGSKTYRPLSLSIRLRADGFSFFVCDLQTASLIRGEHFDIGSEPLHERLAAELARPEYLNTQIAQAYVLVDGPTTYVPLEHFRRDQADDIYRFAIRREEADLSVGYTILPTLEIVELYALSRDVETTILQYHPTARFLARNAMLLERIIKKTLPSREGEKNEERKIYVYPGVPLFVAATHNGVFRMANTFDVSSRADAIYFILNLWHTLDMDAAKDGVVILGHSSDELKGLHSDIAEYVPDVTLLTPTQLFPAVQLTHEHHVPLDLMSLLIR